MDPFTQRMLERARARQEKIDQKLVSSGQTPKRKPLSDNIENLKKDSSPVKSPSKISRDSTLSPKKSIKESAAKSPRRSIQKPVAVTSVATPQRARNDIVVTKKEFKSPRSSKDFQRRGSDVSVEINIMHRDDIQIEVQVEERDAPVNVVYSSADAQSGVIVEEIEQETPKAIMSSETETRSERAGLRQNVKSRLDRLGNLYSESPSLSSPIHRSESQFAAGSPPTARPAAPRTLNRLAALAQQINTWEDDLSHHSQPEPVKKSSKWQPKAVKEAHDSSTLDVSIHSLKDINHVIHNSAKKQSPKGVNSRTFTKPSNDGQQLTTSIVSELAGPTTSPSSLGEADIFNVPTERDGYRRVSASQSRLVFDFTADTPDPARQEPSRATPASATPNMAAMVASQPVAKKPSIKKYKAPTPPRKVEDNCDSDKDKENNVLQQDEEHDPNQNDTECKQTKLAVENASGKSSPVVKRLAPKLNGNVDRSSVLSKAAMFEAGSPRAKEKDPAEMSLRERKALFEKNKGAAIVPKAPFGLAPSVKALHGDKDKKPPTPTKPVLTNNSRTNSKGSVAEDNISQSSVGGGIKGKLAALFNKEQTISESTIANKFKQEREREMEMLQNRFHCKPDAPKPPTGPNHESDDDEHDNDHEKAPLMGSTANLAQAHRRPEIIANIPKVHDQADRADDDRDDDKVQPVKRRIAFSFPLVVGPSQPDPNSSSSWSLNQSCPSLSDGDQRLSEVAFSFPLVVGPSQPDPNSSSSWSLNQSCPSLSDGDQRLSKVAFSFPLVVGPSQPDPNSSSSWSLNQSCPSLSDGDQRLSEVAFSFPLVVGPSQPDPNSPSSWSLNQSCPSLSDGDQRLSEGSQDSPVVLNVLEEVKRIKVNNNKQANGTIVQQPSSIYPHLSDIETDNSHQDEYSDCGGSSTENIPDKMNKSDNWGDTSFGREVMNVVKKNNTSYKKAVQSDSEESGAGESELDDLLDEALDSEGPTPPKQNKQQGSLSSTSFVYKEKTREFKSPLKAPATPHTPHTPAGKVDRGAELVHSVSFYRRMQSASSTPSTPMRVVRHSSPDREPPSDAAPPPAVTTVRQRIKELHEEIAKQQTVISQASQALNLCASTIEFSGSTEQAEGERLLLLATHRRQACLHEVQRLQVEGAGPARAQGMASLSIHGLRAPLRREYVRHLNADGAVGHHAVCLLKCRDRVLATSMQLTRPDSQTLHFPDEVRMDGLASDFKVTVEIYLLQASKEILPHDVKYHINSKKSSSKLLTPKSKGSSLKTPCVQSPAGPLAVRTPQFQPHGYCIFALSQASRNTFTLSKVPHGSPLEGSVHLEIAARVRVPAPEPHAAFLTAFDDVSGLGAWHRRYFRLQAPTLAYWKYPDDVHKKMPIGDINLSTVLSEQAVRCPRDLCARPNTILLESSVPAGLIIPDTGSLVYFRRGDAVVRRHLLAADTPKDRDEWIDCLNKALEYVRCSRHEDDE